MAFNNEVKFIGNVGNDPTERLTPGGKKVTDFRLAVDTFKAGEEGTKKDIPMWLTVVAWEDVAQGVLKTVKKGSRVQVNGRLRIKKYTDAKGTEREAVEVIAESVTIQKKEKAPEDAEAA